MKKNTNDNNDEKVRLALDEHRWINTPVIYTTYGSTFTRFQQDVMLQVSGKLQDHFTKYLNEKRYLSKDKPKSGIAKEDLVNMEPLRLDLSSFGIGDTHYADATRMLDSLTKLFVYAPVFDEETGMKKGMEYMPIFSKVFVPANYTTQEGRDYAYQGEEKYDKEGNVIRKSRRDGYIDVTINVEVAKYAFDMDRGYFNHLERIAFFCNSAFTSRLYLLLMKYVSNGQMHPAIDYIELRDYLGMYDRKEKSDEIIKERYTKFSLFKSHVLDVARRDMERLCEENKIEIMLACSNTCKDGYEPLYRGTAKRGNPEKIKFHIKRTPLGVARELEIHRGSAEQRLHDKILELYPTLDDMKLKVFLAEVPEDMWEDFKRFIYKGELQKTVEKPHQWDGTPEEYVFLVLKKYATRKEEPVQQDLFANMPAEETKDGKKAWNESLIEDKWRSFLLHYEGRAKDVLAKWKCLGVDTNGRLSYETTEDNEKVLASLKLTQEEVLDIKERLGKHFRQPVNGFRFKAK